MTVHICVIGLGLLICTHVVKGNEGHTREKEGGLHTYRVKDVDFYNTKVIKDCLLAQFNATLDFTHTIDGKLPVYYKIDIPQDATTEGSFCNRDYMSELKLNFHGSAITMAFHRQKVPASKPKKISYCDHCDYGTWNLTKLEAYLEIDGLYEVHASTPDNLREYAKHLVDGVDIKRAFKCEESDQIITIPFKIDKVLNASSKTEIHVDWWNGEIKFYLIQLQPFLVVTDNFYDPYLCRDVTDSHVLVIMLPLVYFFIFILFYRIKSEYGCPPRPHGHQKSQRLETEIEIEESTNIMSDEFSTVQMGLTSSSTNY